MKPSTKLLRLVFLMAIIFFFQSNSFCQNDTTKKVTVKSLMEKFAKIWNSDRLDEMEKLLDDKIVLNTPEGQYQGKESVLKDWAKNQMENSGDLITVPVSAFSGETISYFNGRWTMEVKSKDGKITNEEGVHLFIWQKNKSGDWKLKSILIANSISPEPK